MKDYALSPEAAGDLEDIYDYTLETWGEAQAQKYLRDFYVVFETLARHPEMGRARSELEDGLRSIPAGAHVVFYMPWENEVAIVRVLHGSRDVERVFRAGE